MKNKKVKNKKSYYKRIKLFKYILGFCSGFLFACLLDPCNSAFEFGYLVCANLFFLPLFIKQIIDYRSKKNEKQK